MKLDSTQFEKGVEEAKKELQQFEAEAQKSGKAIGSIESASVDGAKAMREYMKSIKNLKGELLQLEEGTEEFNKKMQELADKTFLLRDINETASLSANDLGEQLNNVIKVAGGIAGAFNAVQGAMALFGTESEELEKIMMKLQAGISIVQGIQGLEGLTKTIPILMKSLKMLWGYLSSNPWVILATAIAGLVVALGKAMGIFDDFSDSAEDAQEKIDYIGDAIVDASNEWGKSAGKLKTLSFEYSVLGDNIKAKEQFIKDNAKSFKELGLAINSVKDAEDVLLNNTDKYISAMKLRAQANALQSEISQAYSDAEKKKEDIKEKEIGDEVSYSVYYRAPKGSIEQKAQGGGRFKYYIKDRKGIVADYNQQYEDIDKETEGTVDVLIRRIYNLKNKLNEELKDLPNTTTTDKTDDNNPPKKQEDEIQKLIREVVKTGDRTAYNEEYKKESKNEIGSAGYYNDMLSQLNTYKNSTSNTELIATINELIATLKGEQASLQQSVFKAEHPNAPEQPVYNAEAQLTQIVHADMKELAEEEKPKLKLDTDAMNNYKKQVAEQQEKQVKQMHSFGQQAQAIGGQIQNIFGSIAQCTDDATGAWLNYVGAIIGNASQLISAIMAVTAAQSASSAAQIPIVGFMLVAGAIASTIAAFSAIPTFNDGGVVGGIYKSGDRVLARVNSGEMILTAHQQTRLFSLLNGEATTAQRQTSEVQFRISGKNLVGVLNNYNNKVSKVI